jgi:type IV pilus assembly protein PilB
MKKRLGDILLEMGFIGQDQLDMALAEAKETGKMIGVVLMRLDWITEEQLQLAIAVQSGAKLLDRADVQVDQQLLSNIPLKFVLKHDIFPFARRVMLSRPPPTTPSTWLPGMNSPG